MFKRSDRVLAKVGDDEPIFVLRAQDASAPDTIRGWIERNRDTLAPEHVAEAYRVALAMERWPRRRRPD